MVITKYGEFELVRFVSARFALDALLSESDPEEK